LLLFYAIQTKSRRIGEVAGEIPVRKSTRVFQQRRTRKCMKSTVHLLRDVRGKIGAVFLVFVGFTIKALIEGIDKIGGPGWKDEMVM
jgi:hypothetical protein